MSIARWRAAAMVMMTTACGLEAPSGGEHSSALASAGIVGSGERTSDGGSPELSQSEQCLQDLELKRSAGVPITDEEYKALVESCVLQINAMWPCVGELAGLLQAGQITEEEFKAKSAQCTAPEPTEWDLCRKALADKVTAGAITKAEFELLAPTCTPPVPETSSRDACLAGLDQKVRDGAITKVEAEEYARTCQ